MSDDKPPTAKYRYTMQITGNTLDEISHQVYMLANEFDYETRNRDEFQIQSGTYTQTLLKADPNQTPEQYAASLEAWMVNRRNQRDAAAELTRMRAEDGL